MASAKRQSTTAKITKQAYVAMVAFMVANNCGMIVRIKGVEYGATVRNGRIMIEGDICDYEMRPCDASKYYTVRKQWDSEKQLPYSLDASYDRWIARMKGVA